MSQEELSATFAEIDLDGNGTLEFVEFMELLHKLSSRVRELLRKRAESGEGVVPTGPLFESMLAEVKPPRNRQRTHASRTRSLCYIE